MPEDIFVVKPVSPEGYNDMADEKLIGLYRTLNDAEALNALLKRYKEPLWNYIRYLTWHKKDKSFIDEICQEVLLTIFERVLNFISAGPGSFKSWAYLIAQHKTLKAHDRIKSRITIPFSEIYQEEIPEDIMAIKPEGTNYARLQAELDKALALLTPEEQILFKLLSEEKQYDEIVKIPPFDKYKDDPANLRQKICRLRKFVLSLRMKGQ